MKDFSRVEKPLRTWEFLRACSERVLIRGLDQSGFRVGFHSKLDMAWCSVSHEPLTWVRNRLMSLAWCCMNWFWTFLRVFVLWCSSWGSVLCQWRHVPRWRPMGQAARHTRSHDALHMSGEWPRGMELRFTHAAPRLMHALIQLFLDVLVCDIQNVKSRSFLCESFS